MTPIQQQKAAKAFAEFWQGKEGYEKGQSQLFWTTLLNQVFGIEHPEQFIVFEDQVQLEHTSFIDARIPSTKVMIEQKSLGKDLGAPIPQSDGKPLTPFEQAKRYADSLPNSQRPRWIVTCNFAEFWVYDLEHPKAEPQKIFLKDLEQEYDRLMFLVEEGNTHLKREMKLSVDAGKLVAQIHDALLQQYLHPDSPDTLRSLNILCVRLVFLLYAEDAHLFGKKTAFHDYLAPYPAKDIRRALIDLFQVLDTPPDQRDPYLDDTLKAFQYVNGGLFSNDERLEIPQFTDELKELILSKASDNFDWSDISPTIFGAVFESTLNPETRRSGGMHYTSIENIHKVIDPLFLDDLKDEFAAIKAIPQEKQQRQRLDAFQDKLASLTFFDPACGSGNFLTESYISLRRLENEVIMLRNKGQSVIGDFANPIKVDIHQFYGIEINDFAVSVATTALWIAEQQMMQETQKIASFHIEPLPLKAYHNIHEGNALRMDWSEVIAPNRLTYIMGNPPFVGARMMAQGSEQKKDIENLFGAIKDVQDLDYVCGWYKKAAEFIQNTEIQVGFVSTNSICQGSQVPILLSVLMNDYHIHINYAYRTFKWNSESNDKAAVFCVIVGFGVREWKKKRIYHDAIHISEVKNINPYLLPGDDIFIVAQKETLCDVPKMCFGNQPRDGGYFILSEEERDAILQQEPALERWIRSYIGAEEFINGKKRYCLWLKDASPLDIKQSRILYEKVASVRQFRESSSAKTTQGYAKVPHLFAQMTQPDGVPYLIVPRVSSERREYIPIGYMPADVVSSDAVQIIPNASLYHFGVLTSSMHMGWMRVVCGRLEMRYRYSKEQVYNCFPWPTPTDEQKAKIEKTAQAILDARAKYLDCSLAVLYDKVTMPAELYTAHRENDRAVIAAYGFSSKMTESECVAELFRLYKELTK